MPDARHYIESLTIDEKSAASYTPSIEHDRQVAVSDLIDWNHFTIPGKEGPYQVKLGTSENRVTFSITSAAMQKPLRMQLALQPFRTLIRDYFMICESYKEAVKAGNMAKLEAIDMSRRALHNEGSELVVSMLGDKVDVDFETARRLFTLISVLHVK